MEAFDSIDEAITPRQVANEWRASLPHSTPTVEPIAPSDPHTVSFDDRLRTIVECYTHLCVILSSKGSNTPPMLNMFDDALSQVASVETSVSSLLALRGERAMTMLEAIQMYLHIIPEHHPRRRGAIHLLIKLAHRSEQLPGSLFVKQVTLRPDSRPLFGGFGDVHPGILAGQTVAVKKLRTIGGDAIAYKRLCREALLWRQLRHPNVLPFIGLNKDIFPDIPFPALVSPWMENGSLRDYVKSPKYDAASEVSLLLSGIANGIAYLHALSITHGDIKHLNILVDSACCPRLADFGLVRLDDSATSGGFTNTTNGFDLRWTSPQRLDDHVRALSDDVYSFGCVGYYLYAGRVPFEGFTEARTLMRVMQGVRPSRPSPHNGCSLEPGGEAWDLISRCWAHESDARPGMTEVCRLLAGAQAAPTSTGAPPPASEPITSPAAAAGILAQPVLRLVPTVSLGQDGGDPCDPGDRDSPVLRRITSWCLPNEDSESGGDPFPVPASSVGGDALARTVVGDVDGRGMTRPTSEESNPLIHQVKALYASTASPDDSEGEEGPGPRRRRPRRRGKKNRGSAKEAGVKPLTTSPSDAKVPAKPSLMVPPPIVPSTAASSLVVSEEIIGFGSHGTVVYKGSLQGRAVAVKRLLQDFVTLASHEVGILQDSDNHPNVIRYYYQEVHGNFLYIALELCPASLADIVERPDAHCELAVALEPKRALKQITAGLRHIHALEIVHRDIKPQSILISAAARGAPGRHGGLRMLISDFGLCRRLEIDQTTFLPTAHGTGAVGTVGWRAPEVLRGEVNVDEAPSGDDNASQSSRDSTSTVGGGGSCAPPRPTRLTKSVDIFALGCVFYYTLTAGGHPYGDRYEREVNILKDIKSLDALERFGEEGTEAVDLIDHMLAPEPSKRPDTNGIMLHPYFWDAGRRLHFLQDASDRFEIMCRDPRDAMLEQLETGAVAVVGHDWHQRVDHVILDNLGKFRKYDGQSVQDLMRVLRNKKHHYQDLPENLKRHVGVIPDGFLAYFTRRFPRLFLHVHGVIKDSLLAHESMFRSYFDPQE